MKKEEWNKIKGEEEIPLSLFYQYYLDKGGDAVKSLEEFEFYFPQFMQLSMGGPIITSSGNIKFVNFNSIINKVFKHFDEKFNSFAE